MSKVRVRFAPSPTGVPHLGSLRTALFNFLFAKNQNGEFILRIEDTDQKRLVPGAVEKIKESLELLGLKWDEYYVQSDRLNLYQKYLEELKKKKLVYEDEGAWRFKVEKGPHLEWQDVVHGPVKFSSDVIEDFIIIKSDGFPTYHFASVIDDHGLNITHVFRGDEWLSSTPKHLLLYRALDWQPTIFIHLPPILGSDHKKLSKRTGAKSVMEYLSEGYLPEAIINFLAFLGWAPKEDRELFSLEELTKEFTLDRINKNSPIFNSEKLNWFNKKYLQKIADQDLAKKIKTFSKNASSIDDQLLSKIVVLVKDRMSTLVDFDRYASVFFTKGNEAPPEKSKTKNAKTAIEKIDNWTAEKIATTLDNWILSNNLDSGDFKNTLRLSVFADNTPPIYQSLAVLSKEEVLKRIDDALNH